MERRARRPAASSSATRSSSTSTPKRSSSNARLVEVARTHGTASGMPTMDRHRRAPVAHDARREARAARLRVVHRARRRRRVLRRAAARWLAHGIGEITRIGATTGLRPRERAAFTNAIQRYLVEHTRLGIPAIVHEESTAGLCARDATQFPQAIGLASTWDPDLIERIGAVIREQMVATGARHTLAPVLDVARDPRWGRVEETYGESPYLAAPSRRRVRARRAGRPRARRRRDRQALPRLRDLGRRAEPRARAARAARAARGRTPSRSAPRSPKPGLATVMNSYASVDGLAVRRFEGDPRRPAARRARIHAARSSPTTPRPSC